MTAKELHDKCMALQQEYDDKKSELREQYAIEHNPVKVGDIVTDHYHTIRVEEMSVYGHPIPAMRYTGTELTQKGVPKKHQPWKPNPVFQHSIRIINEKPYKYKED